MFWWWRKHVGSILLSGWAMTESHHGSFLRYGECLKWEEGREGHKRKRCIFIYLFIFPSLSQKVTIWCLSSRNLKFKWELNATFAYSAARNLCIYRQRKNEIWIQTSAVGLQPCWLWLSVQQRKDNNQSASC